MLYETLIPQSRLNKEGFTFGDSVMLDLKAKVEKLGTPLKDWNVSIYRGVLTGYNEAFIITTKQKDIILNSCKDNNEKARTQNIIKPMLRGRDIKRYNYKWAGLWLIFMSWHFPNTDNPKSLAENEADLARLYPALYAHLLPYKDGLKKRSKEEVDKRYEWYCLQRWGANYWQDFEREKIVWNPVSGEYLFAYINETMYFNNSLFMITHNKGDSAELLWILALMNSKLFAWLMKQITNLVDIGKYAYGAKDKIEKLPIPRITNDNKPIATQITQKVEEILTLQDEAKIAQLQGEIDELVYRLYDLTGEEMNYIKE